MPQPFAKLFETTEQGQLLAILKHNEEDSAPEIRVFAEPNGLGVSSVAIGFNDSEEGWAQAEKAFERLGLDNAVVMTSKLFELAGDVSEVSA